MKEKLENSKDNNFIQRKKDYSKGESSPYREWADRKGNYNQEGDLNEPLKANPDKLSEQDSPWFRNDVTEEQLKFIEELLKKLTKRQKQILKLIGYEGKTLEHTAIILGIKKSTVQTTIDRIRKKFKNMSYNSDISDHK